MTSFDSRPTSVLGGDPFNRFRFLHRRDRWGRLNDPDYCRSVTRAAFDAGGRAGLVVARAGKVRTLYHAAGTTHLAIDTKARAQRS